MRLFTRDNRTAGRRRDTDTVTALQLLQADVEHLRAEVNSLKVQVQRLENKQVSPPRRTW